MSRITDRLYLGSLEDYQNQEFMRSKGFKTIISLLDEESESLYEGVQYYKFVISDSPLVNIIPIAEQVYNIITSSHGLVWVNCHQGVSRSSSCVLYYIMKRFHMNYDKALAYVQKHRPIVQPNDGFRNQLIILEEELSGSKERSRLRDYTEALFDQQGQKNKREFLIKRLSSM